MNFIWNLNETSLYEFLQNLIRGMNSYYGPEEATFYVFNFYQDKNRPTAVL